MKLLLAILTTLLGFNSIAQNNEFQLRKETLGKIIQDPETNKLVALCDSYYASSDNLYQSEGYPLWHCRKNCLHVFVPDDSLYVEMRRTDIDSLRHKVLEFFINPTNNILLSDSSLFGKFNGQEVFISKGVVVVQYDTIISDFTEKVIREVANGINDYQEYMAVSAYGKKLGHLGSDVQSELRSYLNWRLLIEWRINVPPPPPPMPDDIAEKVRLIKE